MQSIKKLSKSVTAYRLDRGRIVTLLRKHMSLVEQQTAHKYFGTDRLPSPYNPGPLQQAFSLNPASDSGYDRHGVVARLSESGSYDAILSYLHHRLLLIRYGQSEAFSAFRMMGMSQA